MRIVDFQELIRKELNLYVGETTVRRARDIILQEIRGDHVVEYGRIFDYRDEILRSNSGTRRCIGLDGCFLKGVCKCQLLVSVCKDGNNQMLPIAWPVVEYENQLTWRWFVTLLKHDLYLGDGHELTLISDMQKGLQNAIEDLLPDAEHRRCA